MPKLHAFVTYLAEDVQGLAAAVEETRWNGADELVGVYIFKGGDDLIERCLCIDGRYFFSYVALSGFLGFAGGLVQFGIDGEVCIFEFFSTDVNLLGFFPI